jgi:hypothetical protein
MPSAATVKPERGPHIARVAAAVERGTDQDVWLLGEHLSPPTTKLGGGSRPERIRRHGYASSALAFVFALCMKYNRPSTGMNSKWHRLAAAAKAARLALPTSSISPKAYAVSMGEKEHSPLAW